MRRGKTFAVVSLLSVGLLGILALTGVTSAGSSNDPESEFFGEDEVYELFPGMPMGEMMMPGPLREGDMGGPPAGGPGSGMMGGHPMNIAGFCAGSGFGPFSFGMGCPCMGMMSRGAMPGQKGGMMMSKGSPEKGEPREPHGGHQKGGHQPAMLVFHLLTHPLHHPEGLELTDEERKALAGLREKYLYPAIEQEKALEAAQFALQDILSQPDFSAAKAREYAKKVSALESDLRNLVIQVASEVREVLGTERYARLLREEDHRPAMPGMMMRPSKEHRPGKSSEESSQPPGPHHPGPPPG